MIDATSDLRDPAMRVLVVDDHPLFRQGMKALLAGLDPEASVVEAGTVNEALALAAGGAPVDLVMLDMTLPDCSGLAALASLKAAFDDKVPVVVVSADEDPQRVRAAIEHGAAGYVPKSTDAALTVNALRIVLAHGVYLPPHVLTLPAPQAAPPSQAFSQRQREVLAGLLRGQSNKVIARRLGIAEGTVKAHLWAIYQVLGVTTRTMAMYRAFELGLLDATPPADTGAPP
jgi:DNA-binding NarL/FixJ family response regulator